MRLIYLLIFLLCFISKVSTLQCWTGKIDTYDNGNKDVYIMEEPCTAGYCSNMTVQHRGINETELHCGNQLLTGCDVSFKYLNINNVIYFVTEFCLFIG